MYRGALPLIGPTTDNIEDELDDFESLVPAKERRQLWDFLHTFEGVTQRQKHVLIRRLVDEATLGEIGKELGIDAKAAFNLYRRALARIKKAWQKYE